MANEKQYGVPELGPVTVAILRQALRLGWRDFLATPGYGIFFAAIYVGLGWLFAWITIASGQSYWLLFAAISFPMIGPFAATGLYEISHRRQNGETFRPFDILGVVFQQGNRQLPWLCVMIVVVFLFWFTVAHMIFALFLGLSTMTNISNGYEVYLTQQGLMMLGFGSLVGAAVSLLIYMLTVLSLPMLLDREVDFITAMITSFKFVRAQFALMFAWGCLIAALTLLSLVPWFLGLLIVLPWLGYTSWHLYAILNKDIKKGA